MRPQSHLQLDVCACVSSVCEHMGLSGKNFSCLCPSVIYGALRFGPSVTALSRRDERPELPILARATHLATGAVRVSDGARRQ